MDIIPVNGHILIEPLRQHTYLPSPDGHETYNEIGIVIKVPEHTCNEVNGTSLMDFKSCPFLQVHGGEKVYFDRWKAGKYPTGDGDSFIWLVAWEDIRAIEKNV